MASAVNADHADTADTATNALKLGGYDASDYLRKDEVQTVTAAYQEIEWTSPGTYNWVVPEGVNSILVTTVGGGGGSGYWYLLHYGSTETDYSQYGHLYPGGHGGGIIFNKLIDTHAGDQVTVVVGKGGANINPYSTAPSSTQYIPTWADTKFSGKQGGNGTESYISVNGIKQTSTVAPGGKGGGYGGTTLSNSTSYRLIYGERILC